LSTGFKYTTEYFDGGLSFTNLGMEVLNTNLPLTARIGLCIKPFKNLILSVDLLKPLRDALGYYGGIEYRPLDLFGIRIGYNSDVYAENSYEKLSLGIGLKIENISIDYASAPCGIFGWTHFLTLSYQIRPKVKKPEEIFAKEKMMSETYLNQGIEYYNLGKLEEALNSFDLSLIWLPDNKVAMDWIERVQNEKKVASIEVFFNDGKKEMSKGNYLEALYDFQRALELDSTRADIRNLKIECEKKIKEGTTQNVKELIEQGLAKFNAQDYLKAVQFWNEALKLEPTNATIRNHIAEANQKMIDEITESLRKINTLINQGSFKKAQDLVKKMLRKYPNQENLSKQKTFIDQKITERINEYLTKGRELFNAQKYTDAESEFQKVLEYEPKNVQALSYLEKIKRETAGGKKEDADRYYLLGIDAYTKNNFELAIDYWDKVLKIDPNYPNVKKNLERARIKLTELNK
ncbi:MAG: tetratricopeptide repeat protein, partial [candidate division WOR-3 bacterium]